MSTAFEVISGGNYPANPVEGQCVYNQDTNSPEWFNGEGWVDGSGVLLPSEVYRLSAAEFQNKIIAEINPGYVYVSSTYMRYNTVMSLGNDLILICMPGIRIAPETTSVFGSMAVARVNEDKSITFLAAEGAIEMSYNNYGTYLGYLGNADFSTDAKSFVMGAKGDRPTGVANTGSAFVFDFDDDYNLIHRQYITNHAGITSKNFGHQVAMSEDGLHIAVAFYAVTTTTSNDGHIEWYSRSSKSEDFVYVGNVIESLTENTKSSMYFGYLDTDSFRIVNNDTLYMGPRMLDISTSVYAGFRTALNNGDGTFTITQITPPSGSEIKTIIESLYDDFTVTSSASYTEYIGAQIIHDRGNSEVWASINLETTKYKTEVARDCLCYFCYDVSGGTPVLTNKALLNSSGRVATHEFNRNRAHHHITSDTLYTRDQKQFYSGTSTLWTKANMGEVTDFMFIDFYQTNYMQTAISDMGLLCGCGISGTEFILYEM